MEIFVILLIIITILILLKFIIDTNIKDINKIGKNYELDKLTDKFPENLEICTEILNKLDNVIDRAVTIKEDTNKNSKASLYLVFSNSIIIANIRNSYTRIQTIAHECIHATQNKKLLWFNYIYSNINIIYYIMIVLLTIFGKIENYMLQVSILLILNSIYYMIRSFLEIDAMTKARYIAKEYVEEKNIISKQEETELIGQYDKLNNIGIKYTNYILFASGMLKISIYCIIVLIKIMVA